MPRATRAWYVASLLVAVGTVNGHAQTPVARWPIPIDVGSATTGSGDENNLFLLQLTGRAPLIQTTLRPLSLTALDTLASFVRDSSEQPIRRTRVRYARPNVSLWYNTRRAEDVEGVTWTGRGLTASVGGGAVTRVGPFSFALRPVAFWTQNRPYAQLLNFDDRGSFQQPIAGEIDLPYRFGNSTYGRIDPGESWAQLDTRYAALGISTASQGWGPMHVYPMLLSGQAGGFPHLFAGTGLPLNIGIGKVSARMAVGRLDRSAFALPTAAPDKRRLASELVAVFTPVGMDGLEIGAGRFFHRRWPEDGVTLSALQIPFESILKPRDKDVSTPDNQLADLFFRLVRPPSGFEVYGEYVRDDHNVDIADLVGELDHESGYSLGMRKAWTPAAGSRVSVLTVEIVNGRLSRLSRLRGESPLYIHGQITEGHTERGQLLAAPAALNYGYHVEYERRTPSGGWRGVFAVESTLQSQEGGTYQGTPVGQHIFELARVRLTRQGEFDTAVRVERGWNGLSAGTNIALRFNWRPIFPAR